MVLESKKLRTAALGKNKLRSTSIMTDERLSAWEHLSVERDLFDNISFRDIVDT